MTGPLEGIRIVDLTAIVSGPFATQILADQGADVIKVEPPRIGDMVRTVGYRRGTVSTHLRVDQPQQALHRDRPEEPRRRRAAAGAGGDLRTRSSRISGPAPSNGSASPTTTFGASRTTSCTSRSRASATAAPTRESASTTLGRPDYVRNIVCDKVTSLTAAQMITAALLARATGKGGQHVRLAMLDAAVAFLWPDGMINETFIGDDVRRGLTMTDMYAVFEAADGFMAVYPSSNVEWRALCAAMERPELIEDERFRSPNRRGRNFESLQRELRRMFQGMGVAEVCRRLDAAGVPCAPMRPRGEVANDPQVIANELIVEQEFESLGRVRQPRPAARFGGTPTAIRTAAPALGEHTDQVLRELGRSDAQIARLRASGTIG